MLIVLFELQKESFFPYKVVGYKKNSTFALYKIQQKMKTVRLTVCNDPTTAHIIKGALKNEGIESIFHGENFTSLYPNMLNVMGSGVEILVRESDYEKALEVLNQNQPQEIKLCPYCGSSNIEITLGRKKYLKMFFACLSALIMQPIGNIRTTFHCKTCHKEFDIPSSNKDNRITKTKEEE